MEFCPECGTRLILKRNKSDNKIYLVCSKCSYTKPNNTIITTLKNSGSDIQDQIVIIGEKEKKLQTLPTAVIECPKCGNRHANTWQVQTRGADESSTQFFRCTKCRYTFREYS